MKKKIYQSNFKIGILGGGQLGRMLIQEAINFNLSICTLDPDPKAPCAALSHEFTVGSLTNFDDVYNFGKDKDIITIEIENVNVDALFKLQAEGKKIYPTPETIKIVQDKGLQKEFYQKHQLPSAPFKLVKNKEDLIKATSTFPVVQKARKGGYDGKGVFIVKSKEDFSLVLDTPSILEEPVNIDKELSVIVARNIHGEMKQFPVVEMTFNQKANLVEFLLCPANITDHVKINAEKLALKVAEAFNLVGIMAIEMFLTKSGEILINEVAPRPHNSGHATIEANITSQYEQHLRAILGLPLGDSGMISPSVMVNLLGEEGYTGHAIYENLNEVLAIAGAKVHLYGKEETKPFRKMGHVTVLGKTIEDARKKAEKVKINLKCIC